MADLPQPVSKAMLADALKAAAAALRDADVPFAAFGATAVWALGGAGPHGLQDLDLAVREGDVLPAACALEASGFRLEVPPEDWLFKAWWTSANGEHVLVDLIYEPKGVAVDDELLARATPRSFFAVEMLVIPITDLLVTKLHALSEQHLDFTSLVQFVRPLREQVDWDDLRERCQDTRFARTFFTLLEDIGVLPSGAASPAAPRTAAPAALGRSDRPHQREQRARLLAHIADTGALPEHELVGERAGALTVIGGHDG